ncbi:MAG: phytanoyl-CoA dioxygenase family protein [Luminiphilus sp.]|nr:phytanoyl-CoA dioxygenase family protein [Luminiphilus sp.]
MQQRASPGGEAVQSTSELIDRLGLLIPGHNARDMVSRFDRDGFCVIPGLLDDDMLSRQRQALAPWVNEGPTGRNVFEGTRTHRIYAMLAKDPVFAELVVHPVALAWAEHLLGASCLLSACLAICSGPGESAQPWHTDDGHSSLMPPHDLLGVSTFWALDDTTLENGATEVLPGSHTWAKADFPGVLMDQDFADESDVEGDPGAHPDAFKVTMSAGSLMIARGDLWHRGGANRSTSSRWLVTPQYCAGWLRPLESMLVAVPPEKAAGLPRRVRELLGYSIHPPFMGYSDGMHPERVLPGAGTQHAI